MTNLKNDIEELVSLYGWRIPLAHFITALQKRRNLFAPHQQLRVGAALEKLCEAEQLLMSLEQDGRDEEWGV